MAIDTPENKKVHKFDALKGWLRLWQIWPAFLAIGGGVFWAARLDASQGTILEKQQVIDAEQKIIKDDLRWRYQKEDTRWDEFIKSDTAYKQMMTDRLARMEERLR